MFKSIKRLSAATMVFVALLSQSAVANFDIIDYYNMSILPGITAKKSNAKDDMALNAIMYPIVAEVSKFPFCVGSIDQVKNCVDLLPLATPKPSEGAVPPIEGNNACTSGSFDYAKIGDTYTITFHDCVDDANKRKLQDDLVMKACLYNTDPEILPGNSGPSGRYIVKYTGSVTCSPYVKTASNYAYRTEGNVEATPKMEWQYNVTLDLSTKVDLNGTIRGIVKYGTPFDNWDNMPTTSDEEWQFDNLSLAMGNDHDKYTVDGKYTYIKHPNEAPNPNPDPLGYTFFMDFNALSYTFIHNGDDMDANVSGIINASCHKDKVTYATKTIMGDLDSKRDSNGSRMPSTGIMTSEINAYNVATAQFIAPGTNAQASIQSSDGTNVYDSWREIVTGSSCQGIQDKLDNINIKLPDLNLPEVHKSIVTENILFAAKLNPSSGTVPPPVTGETAGSAVWYYVEPGHGYLDDGTQRVDETRFVYNVTKDGSTSGVHVNAYFQDADGNNVKASIVQGSDNPRKNCNTVNANGNYTCTWRQMRKLHGDWTIRANYWEAGLKPSTYFYNGNFILRIGDSAYEGTEPFSIDKYKLLYKASPQ